MLLLLVALRATSVYSPFPWWDGDPFSSVLVPNGLSPTMSLAVNLGLVLSSLGVLIGVRRLNGRVLLLPGAFILTSMVFVCLHAALDLNTLVGGADLVGASCAGYACWHATQIPKGRAIIAGLTLGMVCVLALVGLHQVFVQHPQTLSTYETNKVEILRSMGWEPGSYQARTYERRLLQAEPTAWFGLSNVFASIVSAMSIGLVALGINTRRTRSAPVFVISGLLGAVLVVLSGSTGAMGALGIGVLIVCLCAWRSRIRIGPVTLVASALVIGGIITRGIIGERIGELSLLFRSQYMQGALKIWGEHPILGVGSGNFQSNYSRLKPPISPEDVSSPHSIVFDLISTLGVGGIALVAFIAMLVWSIGRRDAFVLKMGSPDRRTVMRVLGAVILFSMAISIRLASGSSDVEIILIQLIGSALWFSIAYIVYNASESAIRWATGGAASVLMVHAQLDLTPTFAVSAPLFAVMIGAGGVVPIPRTTQDRLPSTNNRVYSRALLLGALGVILAMGGLGWRIGAWEYELNRAGRIAHAIAIKSDSGSITQPDTTHHLWGAHSDAAGALARAGNHRPSHLGTRIATTEQLMWLVSDSLNAYQDAQNASSMWAMALELADFDPAEPARRAAEHRWAGTVLRARSVQLSIQLGADPDGSHPRAAEEITDLEHRAVEHWLRASELTPHDPDVAVLLMEGYLRLGDPVGARQWAKTGLEINERMRLDPIRQFDPVTLERVELIANQ